MYPLSILFLTLLFPYSICYCHSMKINNVLIDWSVLFFWTPCVKTIYRPLKSCAVLCRSVLCLAGCCSGGGRWRKERAHLRLKWPPSSAWVPVQQTCSSVAAAPIHEWSEWNQLLDGRLVVVPLCTQKHHVTFTDACVSIRTLRWEHHPPPPNPTPPNPAALMAASLWRMWTEYIPSPLFPVWAATLSHHYRSSCWLWNALLGFGMQMLCSGGGGISEESESDEFLINELWNGSPGAIKDELLSISPSPLSLFLPQTYP